MSNDTLSINMLPLTYRQTEISAIARCLRAGDSCSIVGASGMAKSNLFRHLITADTRLHYLGEDWQRYIFLAVDSHALGEMSERAAHNLFIELLLTEARGQKVAESAIAEIEHTYQQIRHATDALIWQRAFAQAAQTVMESDNALHLIILFDQFDEVYKTLAPQFFVNLRSIRDRYKYRISYVVFTRDELPSLAHAAEHEEFYELFSPQVLGLGPYNREDASLLLARISGRFGQSLSLETCDRLTALSGGHPGLLKATCLALLNEKTSLPEDDEQAIDALLAVDDVRTEASKLWGSFDNNEQNALRSLATGAVAELRDKDATRRLRLKNLVVDREGAILPFSPIFSRYIAGQKYTRPAEIRIKAGPVYIDAAGETWVNDQQIVPSLPPMELKLLAFLCQEPGKLRSKEEVVAILYPHLYKIGEAPTDDALAAVVTRLRNSIKKVFSNYDLIETVRKKGYRLNVS